MPNGDAELELRAAAAAVSDVAEWEVGERLLPTLEPEEPLPAPVISEKPLFALDVAAVLLPNGVQKLLK